MTMQTLNTPTKPTLFSSLIAHEVTQTNGVNQREPIQGIRPQLPNAFEMFDLNRDAQPSFEEQAETQAPAQLTQNGIEKAGLDINGLQPHVSASIQELPSQPGSMPKPKRQGQSGVPEFSHDKQQGDNQTPDEQPLAVRILGTATVQMSNDAPIASNNFQPESMQAQRGHASLPEKTIVERTHNFERETIHEIRPSSLFGHISDRSAGVTPKQMPVQTLMPQTEKAPEPTIEIHIGRIEVRAQVQATPAKPEQTPIPSADNRSLQAYLFNRSRGGRS
jgi:hypothetical protein